MKLKQLYTCKAVLRASLLALPFVLGSLSQVEAQTLPKYLFDKTDKAKMKHWADSVYRSLSREEQLSQLIMPIIYPSNDPSAIAREEQRIRAKRWGGILYQKGYLAEQVAMNNRLQQASKTPMLIALDGEWGLYMRLKDAPRYPRNLGLGLNKEDKALYSYGREVARQCRLVGIHINFAPTVDVNINPRNPVIGSRSFGGDAETVAQMSLAYAMGLEDGGVLSVAKHFPGHGDTSEDSHKTLPLVSANRKRLNDVELAPFRSYFNAGLGGVMTAHLRIPALEPSGVPSSLSRKITTDLLQGEMGFGGLVFTDGLEMQGVHAGAKGDVGVAALKAGNDILLGPRSAEAQLSALLRAVESGELNSDEIKRKVMKVLYYKYRLVVSQPKQVASVAEVKSRIWTREAEAEMRSLWQKSLYYLKRKPEDEAKLRRGDYKRIAVVQIGQNPTTPPRLPRSTSDGVKIDYFSWAGFEPKVKDYDYILVNAFTTSVPAEAIARLASQRPLSLIYYSTPFKVKYASWMSSLSSVILTMEAAREAQEAVLSLLTGEVASAPQTSPAEDATSEDPTANMTKRPEERPATTKATTSLIPTLYRQVNATKLSNNVDAIVREALSKGAFPGCQVYVAQYGKTLLNKSYGTLEGSPSRRVTNETIYDIASVSKALATTPAIMLLLDEKKLSLTDRVAKHLPELEGSFAGNASIKNLLLHQSGLAAGLPFFKNVLAQVDSEGRPYYSSKREGGYSLAVVPSLWLSPSARTLVVEMLRSAKAHRPGQYVYSDLNFILLGLIVERASGLSLDKYLAQKLFAPLSAKLYYNPLSEGIALEEIAPAQRYDELRSAKIRGYVDDESAATLGGAAGNAGVFARAEELAKVAQLILDRGKHKGKQIISETTIKQFLSARGVGSVRTLGFIRPQWGKQANQAAESASSEAVGHYGFTGTAVWIDPKEGLVFVFLSNRTYTGRNNTTLARERYRPRLHQAIYDAMD